MSITLRKRPELFNNVKYVYEGKEFTIHSRKDRSIGYVIIEDDKKKLAFAGLNIGIYAHNRLFAYTLNVASRVNEGIRVKSLQNGAENMGEAIESACRALLRNQEYKKKLKELKRGLMQKLLTGQIRVKI